MVAPIGQADATPMAWEVRDKSSDRLIGRVTLNLAGDPPVERYATYRWNDDFLGSYDSLKDAVDALEAQWQTRGPTQNAG